MYVETCLIHDFLITGTGKTALALSIAQELGPKVIYLDIIKSIFYFYIVYVYRCHFVQWSVQKFLALR